MPAGGKLTDADTWVQRHSEPRESLDALGWEEPLVAFRPFSSYNELGSMLDEGPSELYDALEAILGLDELTAAAKRLAEARLARTRRTKEVKEALAPVLDKLAELDDPRAETCREALAGRRWDLAAVEATLTDTPGTAGSGDELEQLRLLAALGRPTQTWPRRSSTSYAARPAASTPWRALTRRRPTASRASSTRHSSTTPSTATQLLFLSSVVEPGPRPRRRPRLGRPSNACHHHAYELAPTADELRGWFEVVDRLLATTDADAGPPPAAPDET